MFQMLDQFPLDNYKQLIMNELVSQTQKLYKHNLLVDKPVVLCLATQLYTKNLEKKINFQPNVKKKKQK